MSVAGRRASPGFRCAECRTLTPKWEGRCPACGAWNRLVEATEPQPGRVLPLVAPRGLDRVGEEEARWRPSSIGELDRVLGGGIVEGGLTLLGGDPGIGKSTLALQLAHALGSPERPSLYCAGEESPGQLAMRARRLGCGDASVEVLAEQDLSMCLEAIDTGRPPLAVIDSVQTLRVDEVAGPPGSPTQIREAVARVMACAKRTGVPVLLVGHVTKDGAIAGPRTLEHMVDVVLYLEGERHDEHRLLRGIKNRFGAGGELGLFRMAASGMEEVGAAGRAFLDDASLEVPGNVLTVTCEGSRALVVEIQALTIPSRAPLPRRTPSGFDLGRLHLLLAVLETRAEVACGEREVYLNCVGGVRLADPAVDLAAALAVAGATRRRHLPPDTVVLGELGLGGEVRRVRRLDTRLAEAAAVGIRQAVIPAGHDEGMPPGLRCRRVSRIDEALSLLTAQPASGQIVALGHRR